MKRISALLVACVLQFALPCFGGATKDPLSSIPSWVNRDSMKDSSRSSFIQKNSNVNQFLFSENQRYRAPFSQTKTGLHVELSYFKVVDDKEFGKPPVIRDWDKDFLIPLPDDFKTLNRNLLRVRPSLMLDDDWKLTVQKVKVKDGSLEGRFLLERKFK